MILVLQKIRGLLIYGNEDFLIVVHLLFYFFGGDCLLFIAGLQLLRFQFLLCIGGS